MNGSLHPKQKHFFKQIIKILSWAGAVIASSLSNKSFYIFSYTNRSFPGVPTPLILLSFPPPGSKCYHLYGINEVTLTLTWCQVPKNLLGQGFKRAESIHLTSTDCMPPIGQSVAPPRHKSDFVTTINPPLCSYRNGCKKPTLCLAMNDSI